jgi:chromosome segregation ATPase
MRTIATLFIVTMITLPMIFSVRISADKFTEIQNEIREFCNSITVEQKEADERFAREKLWCEREIKKAEDLVAKRKKEVAALEAQVKALEDKIADNKKAIKQYSDKIAENNKNMAEYKTQRCDANFNYITLLREHYDSQDMLKQLKKDLDEFLDKKIANPNDESIKLPTSFIERVTAFGHLIPSGHQTALIETMQAVNKYVQAGDVSGQLNDTKTNHYEARNITDTLHVDNTRGELKPMDHVAHIEPKQYFIMLKTKIDNIIAGLLKHLEQSLTDLSTKEMKANEDYAKFMIALEKENAELAKLIEGLEAENKALTAQLEKTQETLDEFRKLLKAAEENLARLKKMCEEKVEYHERENKRRQTEAGDCAGAMKIFNEVLGTDEELKALLNDTADLKSSKVIENQSRYNTEIDNNEAKDIKVVF